MLDKKVVCLHVPYPRLVKHALCKPFIELLSKRFELKILAPFSIEKEDLDYLGLKETQFIYYDLNLTNLQHKLIQIIDYYRRYSYFFKNRMKIRISTHAKLLTNKKYPLILRITASLIFQAGLHEIFWKILDQAFLRFYTPKPILNLDFECNLMIQFSNWGVNDYVVKNAKFVEKAQKVMFPYTSDQIYVTGHFLHRFDRIYCQSQVELEMLNELHDYKGYSSIAGSLWFRHVDYILKNESVTQLKPNTIVYAGVSSEFFPKMAEANFIEKLIEQFPKYEVLYLPYFNKNEKKELLPLLQEKFKMRTHETAISELSACRPISVKESIIKYLENINGATLFIMSFNTSMGIDFSYLNQKKVFSYFYDEHNQVKDGAYSKMERVHFHGPNYLEIDSTYKFRKSDFFLVNDPAANRWDQKVQLDKIIEELDSIV